MLKDLEEQAIERGMEKGMVAKTRGVIINGYKKGLALDLLAELAGVAKEEAEEVIAEFMNAQKGYS